MLRLAAAAASMAIFALRDLRVQAKDLGGVDVKLMSCETAAANIRFFNPIFRSAFGLNESFSLNFTDYGLFNLYDVRVDGRRIGSPSRGTWKIEAGVPHTLETMSGPYYTDLFAMVTSELELHRAIAPCVLIKTPDNVGDDYIDAHNYYYDNWAELPSCPIESEFKTNGYVRQNYFFNSTTPREEYQDNTTCTVFQADGTSKVTLDLTLVLGSTYLDLWYAYGNVTLQNVASCKALLGTCGNSTDCCLGLACIKTKATAATGKCRECKSLGTACVSADACCDGLRCGSSGRCVAA